MPANPIDIIGYLDDLAETIANPNPDRPFSDAIGANGRAVCRAWSAAPTWAQNLAGPTRPVLNLMCKPYLDTLGYSTPELNSPGFSGGQCAGTLYQISGTYVASCFFNQTLNWSTQVYGPVESVTFFQGDIASGWAVKGRNASGAVAYGNCTRTGSSQAIAVVPRAGVVCGQVFSGGIGQDGAANPPTITSVTAISGPDDCGDPPETVVPGPNPDPSPPTIPPDQQPYDGPGGRPFLPIPPIEVPGFPDVDVENPYEPPSGGGGATDSQPQPGDEIEGVGGGSGGGDNPFGEPPDGTRWVGACVRLTATPDGLGVIPSSIPENVYAEVVGNARLYLENDSQSTYDTPVQLRSQTVCCWEPVKGLRPVGMRVNLKPLYFYTVTPYYVPLETP